MAVEVTYPGVYIEEIPSGVQPITGVATSITAFMGTALRGPLGTSDDGPTTIFSFADFEHIFGGLWVNSSMSYAVRDFFNNGGGQAVVVRLYESSSASAGANVESAGCARISLKAPPIPPAKLPVGGSESPISQKSSAWSFYAASPGGWGNNVRVMFDTYAPDVAKKAAQALASFGVPQDGSDLFNITIFNLPPGGSMQTERFVNLTLTDYTAEGFPPSPYRVDRCLNENSQLVQMFADDLPTAPAPTWLAEWTKFSTSPSLPVDSTLLFQSLYCAAGGADGNLPLKNSTTYTCGDGTTRGGFYALDKVDLFNLLCVPYDAGNPDSNPNAEIPVHEAYSALAEYCQRRRAMFIIDAPSKWSTAATTNQLSGLDPTDLGIDGLAERNAAIYFPRVIESDPVFNGQSRVMPACGIIAGVMASTDVSHGVWKAPAGVNAGLNGILNLEVNLTDDQNGRLNQLGINCLRSFPVIGPVVWGARTLRGAEQLQDDYKYIPVRRLTLYIEESVYRGTRWAVFEPNAEPLWTSLRSSVNTFLLSLQQQGAFYSFFVKCDSTTTTMDDIALGIVNISVGISPVTPAEFVIIQIQQTAGNSKEETP